MRVYPFGIALVAMAFASAAAFAAATSVALQDGKIIVPAASPISHPAITETQEAVFPGTFAVSGTLELDYRDEGPGISFTPDAADARRLPFVENDHKVGSLNFDDKDYDSVIAAAVPAAMVATVKAQHNKRVAVHVTLEAERYTAVIEGCTGEGFYTVHVLSAHPAGAPKIVPIPPRKPGDDEDC